jgi:hypothetical protein
MTLGEFREATKDQHDSTVLVGVGGLPLHVHDVSCGVVFLSDSVDEHVASCITCRQPVLAGAGTLLASVVDEPRWDR